MDFGLNKIKIAGDREKARCYIGQAVSQMNILINQMSFQNLTQGWRRLWLNENVYIECGKVFNHQECRIWCRPLFKPVETVEEVLTGPVHFYVRIKKPSQDIDRIIIWRMQEMIEAEDIPERDLNDDYIDRGFYIDGTEWGIIEEGEVILDVNVLIPPTTPTLEQEAQLALARQYIAQIDGGKAPEDRESAYLEREYLIDPIRYAQTCSDYDTMEDREADSVGLAETFPGDRLPRKYPHIYSGNRISQADCDDPEHIYNDHTWPLILESQDYYPRSTRSARTTGVCTVTGPTIFWPESEVTASFGEIPVADFVIESYWDGFAYTTKAGDPEKPEEGIPCFFVGLYGKTETSTRHRYPVGLVFPEYDPAYPNRCQLKPPRHYNDVLPCREADGETGWGSEFGSLSWTRNKKNVTKIVTPFETIIPAEVMLSQVSPCNEPLVRELNSSMDGVASSVIIAYGSTYDSHQLNPQEILPDYPGTTTGYASIGISGEIEDFHMAIDIHEGSGEDKNWMSMFIFYDARSQRTGGTGNMYFPECDRSHLEPFDPDDPDTAKLGYSVGVTIYLLSPLAFQWEDVETGKLEFFDIHQRRDADTNRINSNRALGLEEYINEILQEYHELPSNIYSTGLHKMLINEYDIYMGFVYQI